MEKINCHLINASICLTDLKAEKLKKATNGKVYLNFVVNTRKEKDQFGNDLNMSYAKTKEEKEAKVETVYIQGNAQSVTFESPEPAVMTNEGVEQKEIDNLPWE
jgi:hypothetical protein